MGQYCAFCNRQAYKGRVLAETGLYYLFVPVGQITDGGCVYIVPKNHVSCFGEMTRPEFSSMYGFLSRVCAAIKKEYGEVTIFEHGIAEKALSHAHLCIIPARIEFAPRIIKDFPGAEIRELCEVGALTGMYWKKSESYLFWQAPGGPPTVCWNSRAPKHYLKDAAADLLGMPGRLDWRGANPYFRKRLVQETIDRLRRYF